MTANGLNSLVGAWEKTTDSLCSKFYPDHIVFRKNGIYAGHRRPQGTFTTWDAGKYEIAGENRVRISTANDAITSYQFTLHEDVLTFEDEAQCRFAYRRVSD